MRRCYSSPCMQGSKAAAGIRMVLLGFSLSIILVGVLGQNGCSKQAPQQKTDTPTALAETYLTAIYNRDLGMVNQCYGAAVITRTGDDADNLRYRYMAAMEPDNLTIIDCEEVGAKQGIILVGIAYRLKSADKNVPGYEKVFVEKNGKQYRILADERIPENVKSSWELQEQLNKTEKYQEYLIKEENFERSYPDFFPDTYQKAENITLTETDTVSRSGRQEILMVCLTVVAITIVQLMLMGVWRWRMIKLERQEGKTCRTLKKNDGVTAKNRWMSILPRFKASTRPCSRNY